MAWLLHTACLPLTAGSGDHNILLLISKGVTVYGEAVCAYTTEVSEFNSDWQAETATFHYYTTDLVLLFPFKTTIELYDSIIQSSIV